MSKWVLTDREQALLLPPSIDELLPEDHLARFVVEVCDQLDLSPIVSKYERRGRGSTPYHPAMMLALLFYGYATGTMSSRKIERGCRYDLAFRYIAAGHAPDHDTIATFRRRHLPEISQIFVHILLLAREMGFLKVGTVAIDGTKVRANASKHASVSYKRAQVLEKRFAAEVNQLLKMAEEADNTPRAEGIDIPAEIARREKRIERLREAQIAIIERHGEKVLGEYEKAAEDYLNKLESDIEEDRRPSGDPPDPPDTTPPDSAQYNFTDPDSRIMPEGGGAFCQAYNAQAAVDCKTMLIVGQHLSQCPNDKRELLPALDSINKTVGTPALALADSGYFSADNINKAPVAVLIAPRKTRHNQPLRERLAPAAKPEAEPQHASAAERMRHRLATAEGRANYRLRKMTVEPVFGIIKATMGLRQFLLRGAENVRGEWALACTAYNITKLWRLKTAG